MRRQYEEMIRSVLERAVELETPELLVEFETLAPMTDRPEWGLEISGLSRNGWRNFTRYGLWTALRLTPTTRGSSDASANAFERTLGSYARALQQSGKLGGRPPRRGVHRREGGLRRRPGRGGSGRSSSRSEFSEPAIWIPLAPPRTLPVPAHRAFRRYGLRVCQHGDGAGETEVIPRFLRRSSGSRRFQGAWCRTASGRRAEQGLCLRGSLSQGDRGHPDLYGGPDRRLRAS